MRRLSRGVLVGVAFLIALAGGVATVLSLEPHPKVQVGSLVTVPPSERLVVVEGTVREVSPNRFLLEDGTGEIALRVCPTWFLPLEFGPRERVRVIGHLAARQVWLNGVPAFQAYRIEGEGGTRVTLRHNDGVPLWHTYRALPGGVRQSQVGLDTDRVNSPRSPGSGWY